MESAQWNEKKAWIVLNKLSLRGAEFQEALSLLSGTELLQKIRDENFLEKREGLERILVDFHPEAEMEKCEKHQITVLSFKENCYPSQLKHIYDPPLVLYCRGRILDLDEIAVAIVGTRRPSFYGRSQAVRFSSYLSESGLTVVSGFAQGVDQAAHEAALQSKQGRSVAVLGSGLDVLYPRGSEELFEKLIDQGAVISEFPMGTPPLKENFPRRNRIISGLSLGVLVIEAHARSGSLITAHQAIEQGRDVFALPGPVDQLTSKGTHALIKEGAFLVEGPEDVLETLHEKLKEAIDRTNLPGTRPLSEEKKPELSEQEKGEAEPLLEKVNLKGYEKVKAVLQEGPLVLEEISNALGLSEGETAFLLMQMECKKMIQKRWDGRFSI